ncbi:unnamed protein product, partial [Closterium sp. Naga37s-1]
ALFLPRGMPLSSLVQLSPRHSQGPIVVATHNCHLDDVLAQVPPARHSDLVLVQNGMLDGWLAEHGLSHSVTRVLLYMAASGSQGGASGEGSSGEGASGEGASARDASVRGPTGTAWGGAAGSEGGKEGEEGAAHARCQSQQHKNKETEGAVWEAPTQPQLPVCFTSSPRYPHGVRITDGGGRSVATGRWAPLIARLLSASEVPCTPVPASTFRELAGEKLLWSCIFWLLCAARGGAPLGEVVSADRGTMRALAGELWPLLVAFWQEGGSESGGRKGEGIVGGAREAGEETREATGSREKGERDEGKGEEERDEEGEYEVMCERLCAYSMAIPAVVPSMPMALAEFPWRNGWFLRSRPTPMHTRLLASLLPLYPQARDVILPYLPAEEASTQASRCVQRMGRGGAWEGGGRLYEGGICVAARDEVGENVGWGGHGGNEMRVGDGVMHGRGCMAGGAWQGVHGRGCMAGGAWQGVHGRGCMAGGAWQGVHGRWCMAGGAWQVVHGRWCMAGGAWQVVPSKV